MSRLIMWNLVTLDGYFEGAKSWDLGFHEYAWGEELEALSLEQLKKAKLLVFGRATYEGMASYWTKAEDEGEVTGYMNSLPKLVVSNSLKKADWNNTRLVGRDFAAEIARLKTEGGGDMFVFGSADLSASLTEKGLFDEYRICLVPVLLGGGRPLFKTGFDRLRLKLVATRPLASGAVILSYEPLERK
jgi:dihydrofolate reductase